MKHWYYATDNQQRGPVDDAALRGMIARGQLGRTHLVWTEGMAQWQAIGEVPELQSAPQARVHPAIPPIPPAGSIAPLPQPGYEPFGLRRSAQGLASGGLACSILGLFCGGGVLGIVGIVLSAVALSQMKTYGNPQGRGQAIAGLVIGLIGIPMGFLMGLWFFMQGH